MVSLTSQPLYHTRKHLQYPWHRRLVELLEEEKKSLPPLGFKPLIV
jgi:hypothetical protein